MLGAAPEAAALHVHGWSDREALGMQERGQRGGKPS